MNSRIFALSHSAAATRATVMAVSACALLSSSVPFEHDPFRTEVRVAQWHGGTGSICPNNPDASDPRAPVCLRV
jgi:hypothetical protein